MTRHLNDGELVDYVDGAALPAPRAAHVAGCDACRDRAASLRADISAIQRLPDARVPEPSPLYWEHFSSRIRLALDEAAPPSHASWFRTAWIGWVGAAAAVCLALWVSLGREQPPAAPASAAIATEQPAATDSGAMVNLDDDEDWALVRVVAAELHWEDAPEAGIIARPGSAERVALEMSPEERQELARLLEDDLKRTGA